MAAPPETRTAYHPAGRRGSPRFRWRCLPIDPVLGALLAALDLVGRHLAAIVRGLPIEKDPAGALARGLEGSGLAGGLQGAGGAASTPAEIFELGIIGTGGIFRVAPLSVTIPCATFSALSDFSSSNGKSCTRRVLRRVHRRLQILVLDVDGVAGLRLFVLGGLEGIDIGIEHLLEILGAYWLVNWGGLGKTSGWASRPLMISWIRDWICPREQLFPASYRLLDGTISHWLGSRFVID